MRNIIRIESNNYNIDYVLGSLFCINDLEISVDEIHFNKEAFKISYLYSYNNKKSIKRILKKKETRLKKFKYDKFRSTLMPVYIGGKSHLDISKAEFESLVKRPENLLIETVIDLEINDLKYIIKPKKKGFDYGYLDTLKIFKKIIGKNFYFEKEFLNDLLRFQESFKITLLKKIDLKDKEIILFMIEKPYVRPWYLNHFESKDLLFKLLEDLMQTFNLEDNLIYNMKLLKNSLKKETRKQEIITDLFLKKPYKEKDVLLNILKVKDSKKAFINFGDLFLQGVLLEVLLDEKIQ